VGELLWRPYELTCCKQEAGCTPSTQSGMLDTMPPNLPTARPNTEPSTPNPAWLAYQLHAFLDPKPHI
jgi:hypothetical protein